ncbi:MAG: MBL fold metallo-hydrolase [Haliea sp.]|jgi:alkyl sulfatase BDS1-like metallo-beta-lactamase superfamily hydrolase|nr:MBL fold metallo-hydrolase [Haliea sp.]
MKPVVRYLKDSAIAFSLICGLSGPAQAGDFSYPQGVYNGEPVSHTTMKNGGMVNSEFPKNYALTKAVEPRIIEVAEGVWTLAGHYFVYPTIIEGDTGLIIFDTGDDIVEGQGILDFASQVSDKPVSAIIYSHAHYSWGAKPMVAAGKDVKVIGHPDLNGNVLESSGLGAAIPELTPILMARGAEQFSVLLPKQGPDAGGPSPVTFHEKGFVPVNTPVSNGQKLTVDGVEMVFYTDYAADTNDTVIVHLPEKEMVLNNHLWGNFPNIYTLRGSEYRDPTVWIEALRLIRDLEPAYLLNTHAVPVIGKEKVQETLGRYSDAIAYLYDQTIRGILHGKTPEELRYWVQLPTDLAAFPNNQLTYGELSYYPPYIHNHALGWFGRDVTTLNRIAPQQQAEKIVAGFGGVEAVKEDVAQSIGKGELAWAAELGGYLVRVAPSDQEARQLLADALRQMAYNSMARIPRSFYLTRALALEGKIQVPVAWLGDTSSVLGSPPDTYVKQYRVRLDPRASLGSEQQLSITISDADAPTMALHVRGGVAEFVPDVSQYHRKSDMSISMPLDAWASYYVGDITLSQLLDREGVMTSDKKQVKAFFSLFDQVHASKAMLIAPSDIN